MPGSPTPIELFLSYAPEDESLREELEKYLSLLRQRGLITTWHDRQILAGTDWEQTIDVHLTTASVILLLISADFLASDYCYGFEMQQALQRHQENQARVIPVLLRPVDWRGAPFAHLPVLPTNARPITTWKNRDEALADVTAGIRRAIEDLTLLEASGTRPDLSPIWNVPYARSLFFTGRDQLLARLHEQLFQSKSAALNQSAALSGLGGIGKTQTAIEYAYRHRDEYSAVFWARADSRETLVADYVAIARMLSLPGHDAQEQMQAVNTVKRWLQEHEGWLLILDYANDLALVADFLPRGGKGHLLLTTRAQATGKIARSLLVEKMEQSEGMQLLLRRAKVLAPEEPLDNVSAAVRKAAQQLVRELDGLPLALDQAGAYMEETGCSLSEYLQLYAQRRLALLGQQSRMSTDYPHTVASTWALSFSQVEQAGPAAADLLRLCAFLHPDAIPEEIIVTGAHYLGGKLWPVAADPFLLNQAIQALRAYSLVKRDPEAKLLNIHRLVQVVIGESLPPEARDLWRLRAVLALDSAFPDVEFKSWLTCELLLPHALHCAAWIDQPQLATLQAARLLNQAGLYLKVRAIYAQAEPLYQRALSIYERLLGPIHPDTATILNNLALLYAEQGKYAEAEPLFQRALAVREQQFGAGHPSTAASLDNLANLYVNERRYAEAEPLLQRALAIWEQQLGPDHLNMATSLDNLALLYVEQEKYAEAEPLYQRAIAIQERELGPLHPSTAASLDNLANLYVNQGKYEQAEPLLQRALVIREQQLGPMHPSTATSLNNLAILYAEQGKYAEAEPLYQRALTICEQMLGQGHPHTQKARKNYEWLLQRIGQSEGRFERGM